MSLTILAVIAVIVAILILLLMVKPGAQGEPKPEYTQVKGLLTNAEHSFYKTLVKAKPINSVIFTKVRVADLLKPHSYKNRSEWQMAFNKISAKHFDFVICNAETLDVICVIELDDKSHTTAKVKDRDLFLDDACSGAELKLIRFKAQKNYQVDSIRNSIMEVIICDGYLTRPKNNTKQVDEGYQSASYENSPPIENTCNKTKRLPSSKVANKLGIKTPEFLDLMVKRGYLIVENDKHQLTEKGKQAGGLFVDKGRTPAHFTWLEPELNLSKEK